MLPRVLAPTAPAWWPIAGPPTRLSGRRATAGRTLLAELDTPLSVFQAGGELVVLPGGVLLTDGSTTWFGQAQPR